MTKAQMEIAQTVAEVFLAQIEPLKREIAELKAQIRPQEKGLKTITDIVRDFQYSRATVQRTPWLKPNFGRSDFPGRIPKWRSETYEAWFSTNLDLRRKEWERMGIRERAKYQ